MVSSQLQDAINNTKIPSRVPHVISQLCDAVRAVLALLSASRKTRKHGDRPAEITNGIAELANHMGYAARNLGVIYRVLQLA